MNDLQIDASICRKTELSGGSCGDAEGTDIADSQHRTALAVIGEDGQPWRYRRRPLQVLHRSLAARKLHVTGVSSDARHGMRRGMLIDGRVFHNTIKSPDGAPYACMHAHTTRCYAFMHA